MQDRVFLLYIHTDIQKSQDSVNDTYNLHVTYILDIAALIYIFCSTYFITFFYQIQRIETEYLWFKLPMAFNVSTSFVQAIQVQYKYFKMYVLNHTYGG